jgi:hypothetical protein
MEKSTEAVELYTGAVERLHTSMGVVSINVFEEIRTIAEVARDTMQRAMKAVTDHTADHGC